METETTLIKMLAEQLGQMVERVGALTANTQTRLDALDARVAALERLAYRA